MRGEAKDAFSHRMSMSLKRQELNIYQNEGVSTKIPRKSSKANKQKEGQSPSDYDTQERFSKTPKLPTIFRKNKALPKMKHAQSMGHIGVADMSYVSER